MCLCSRFSNWCILSCTHVICDPQSLCIAQHLKEKKYFWSVIFDWMKSHFIHDLKNKIPAASDLCDYAADCTANNYTPSLSSCVSQPKQWGGHKTEHCTNLLCTSKDPMNLHHIFTPPPPKNKCLKVENSKLNMAIKLMSGWFFNKLWLRFRSLYSSTKDNAEGTLLPGHKYDAVWKYK